MDRAHRPAMKYDHGTHAAYVIDRCRCAECKAANSAYERARARRVEPAYVLAQPARNHLVELAATGVGLNQVAKVSGVSHGALSKLVYGTANRAPSKRIRKTTLDAILAVTPADAAGGAKVDGARTWELIEEMVAAGVPKVRIATGIGQRGPGLQLGRTTVSARNARAIAALHGDWRAGRVHLVERISRWQTPPTPAAPPATRRYPPADVSDLLLELAEIVEERNEQAAWRSQAACRGRPTWMWFPGRGDRETMQRAQRICGACVVRDQCRAANYDKSEGVYGGLSAKQRRIALSADVQHPRRSTVRAS